jgi:hypothetical protein
MILASHLDKTNRLHRAVSLFIEFDRTKAAELLACDCSGCVEYARRCHLEHHLMRQGLDVGVGVRSADGNIPPELATESKPEIE